MPPVYDWLSADSAITTAVGDRIFRHGRADQGIAKPYITWSVVAGHAETYIEGSPGIDQELTQVDIWSKDEGQCLAIMRDVRRVLEAQGYQQGAPIDDFEDDTKLYRYTLRFHFWTSR